MLHRSERFERPDIAIFIWYTAHTLDLSFIAELYTLLKWNRCLKFHEKTCLKFHESEEGSFNAVRCDKNKPNISRDTVRNSAASSMWARARTVVRWPQRHRLCRRQLFVREVRRRDSCATWRRILIKHLGIRWNFDKAIGTYLVLRELATAYWITWCVIGYRRWLTLSTRDFFSRLVDHDVLLIDLSSYEVQHAVGWVAVAGVWLAMLPASMWRVIWTRV